MTRDKTDRGLTRMNADQIQKNRDEKGFLSRVKAKGTLLSDLSAPIRVNPRLFFAAARWLRL
jgi:hypothetical protein